MEETEEGGWVRAAQRGDLAAFDRLVRRYRPAATLTARSVLTNRPLADDAVQDAFVAAYKALPALADPDRFGAWLARIVRNRALRLRMGERAPVRPLDGLILAYVPSIQGELEGEAERSAVRCAVEALPEELRTAVALYYLNGWSVADIARYADLPATTVKWRLHTGRQRLRTLLSKDPEEKRP